MMRLLLLLLSMPVFAGATASATAPSWSAWLISSLMVIGLILVLGFLLKKSRIATVMGGGQMRVIASLPVGYKEKLLVVKVGEQQLLVGVTPQQINFLYRLDAPLDETQPPVFSQQLSKLMGKHEES